MKFTMISTLATALAIVSATPITGPIKPLFPRGYLSLKATTAGNQLAGYLPQLIVGYTGRSTALFHMILYNAIDSCFLLGDVFLSKQVPVEFGQPVRKYSNSKITIESATSSNKQPIPVTGFRGISFDKVEFGFYYYLTIQTKESMPVTFRDKEGCPAPDIGNDFNQNWDDKLYYFPDPNTPLNLWKACLSDGIAGRDYIVYWDSNNSISINDSKKCIKIDIHVTDLGNGR